MENKTGSMGRDPQNLFEGKVLMAAIQTCLADMPEKMSLAFTLREKEN